MVTAKQKGVLRGMALAGAVTLFAGAVGLSSTLHDLIPENELAARLSFVASWSLLLLVWLLIAIATLARHRFFTPQDIDGSGLTAGSDQAKCYQAILQNTLEQTGLALPLYLAGSVMLPQDQLALLPLLAMCFTVGRLLFTLGYRRGASARAFGFALTFYPTVLLFVVLLVHLTKGLF